MFDKICKKYTSVKSPEYFLNLKLPQKFDCPYNFVGYGEQLNPNARETYKTTSMEYGWKVPDQTENSKRFPKRQNFSSHLARCGMYRNFSLNTVME